MMRIHVSKIKGAGFYIVRPFFIFQIITKSRIYREPAKASKINLAPPVNLCRKILAYKNAAVYQSRNTAGPGKSSKNNRIIIGIAAALSQEIQRVGIVFANFAQNLIIVYHIRINELSLFISICFLSGNFCRKLGNSRIITHNNCIALSIFFYNKRIHVFIICNTHSFYIGFYFINRNNKGLTKNTLWKIISVFSNLMNNTILIIL